MNNFTKVLILAFIIISVPISVGAQTSTPENPPVINPNQLPNYPDVLGNPVRNGLNIFGFYSGFANTDIRLIIANIIGAVMSFIGIIMVVLIIWGGFLWLTSGGNEEQVAKAKSTLINAVIGLIIILAANSIVNFLVNSLTTSTGSSGV